MKVIEELRDTVKIAVMVEMGLEIYIGSILTSINISVSKGSIYSITEDIFDHARSLRNNNNMEQRHRIKG